MNDVRKAKPIELDCGHTVWFKNPPTTEDELLFCFRCSAYREIRATTAAQTTAWVYWPEWDFKSKKRRNSNVYDGECTFQDENGRQCRYESRAAFTFAALRDRMHVHYMRMHTNYGAQIHEGTRG